MTILSDSDIGREVAYGDLEIDPYREKNLQPASYDLTLGNEWIVPVEAHPDDKPVTLDEGLPESAKRKYTADTFIINPMQPQQHGGCTAYDSAPFVLGCVEETIELPDNIVGLVKGRSSIGRLGIIPHTAGLGDPGWGGDLTLEFANLSANPIELDAGRRIAQVLFCYTDTSSSTSYAKKQDAKYQGQTGVTESRIEEDT